jgi:hypothetical protein
MCKGVLPAGVCLGDHRVAKPQGGAFSCSQGTQNRSSRGDGFLLDELRVRHSPADIGRGLLSSVVITSQSREAHDVSLWC